MRQTYQQTQPLPLGYYRCRQDDINDGLERGQVTTRTQITQHDSSLRICSMHGAGPDDVAQKTVSKVPWRKIGSANHPFHPSESSRFDHKRMLNLDWPRSRSEKHEQSNSQDPLLYIINDLCEPHRIGRIGAEPRYSQTAVRD